MTQAEGNGPSTNTAMSGTTQSKEIQEQKQSWWKLGRKAEVPRPEKNQTSSDDENDERPPERWSLGILNDRKTEEVPGTILLLSSNRNEPLGLRHAPRNTSSSSLPAPYATRRSSSVPREKKKTADGKILLDPQPEDSLNDPLNWPAWRRDSALLSLGFYCMLGGGITPLLAAGFQNVSHDFGISTQRVALTTGLYMMGLGLGSVIASPTAILFGKRPVYLFSAIIFVLSSVWCAKSPNFASLVVARIFQGIAVSPVECLPSATIAEIFFLHERAFRIGIYTLLLLSGKNLIPLVSAAIIQALGWRWAFWMVAIVAGFGFCLLFAFVPETFWDRTPRPKPKRPHMGHRSLSHILHSKPSLDTTAKLKGGNEMTPRQKKLHHEDFHVGFVDGQDNEAEAQDDKIDGQHDKIENQVDGQIDNQVDGLAEKRSNRPLHLSLQPSREQYPYDDRVTPKEEAPQTPVLHNMNSPYYLGLQEPKDYLAHQSPLKSGSEPDQKPAAPPLPTLKEKPSTIPDRSTISTPTTTRDPEKALSRPTSEPDLHMPSTMLYTHNLRQAPKQPFSQMLRPFNGRLSHSSWFHVAIRPFILFTYPSILWSTIIYSNSIGWLIVLSESVSTIYRSRDTYNFSALGVGLVYISPFIGGVLGTAIAGRVSDIIVRFMSRRNGGVYEPEFRLVMALPILISTAVGLMGFGWSVEEHDAWIVPTIFFGIISFGCSLGSTTSITFAVDSYRQFAGEALVTLNFSKNIFHGLVWSLFFPKWLEKDGPKMVFLVVGGLQIAACLTSLPMYIYGKRARMWTVRRGAMERFG